MSYLDVIDTLQSIADGVLFGATYSLLGIGFTLVFGVMHKINLSYAAASIGAAYASLIALSVDQFYAFMRTEAVNYRQIIKDANLKSE